LALAFSSLFSFSPLRNLDPEGPLRPACNPEGDPANPMVNIGSRLWNRSLELGREANCCGLFFTIEHPRSSRAWQMKSTRSTRRFRQQTGAWTVNVDWCCYRGWKDPVNRKATHDYCPMDQSGARKAAAYPLKFCRELAQRCALWYG
jgi:hypothetical protein